MTIVNDPSVRTLAPWLPALRVEPYLEVYERIALGTASNPEIMRAAKVLGRLMDTMLSDWRGRDTNPSVDMDFDNELVVDVKWAHTLANSLRYAGNRMEAVLALDEFFNHYHEDLEACREITYANGPEGRIIKKLRDLFGEDYRRFD